MKSYGEYCPIAMGAEAIGDRWTPLVLRELICGSQRFSDIHRGMPRMSRTLLAQRLKQLERLGLVERREGPTYHLTSSGQDLEAVVWGIGDWAMRWLFGDPEKEHLDGAHLMWRVRQRLVPEALPEQRTVVQFEFPGARRGRRIWLLLDPAGSSVCERDEGFDVDLVVTAEIDEIMRIWMGRSTWDDAVAAGKLAFAGPSELVRAFPSWFALSPFATRR
ncbi:MAG TPA: helix-turn-helix domain-containing protein [Acidimicrobiales bacterium]|nr:helix-turn-helix domain-containing protein [Acidimicrobiales bacterium]